MTKKRMPISFAVFLLLLWRYAASGHVPHSMSTLRQPWGPAGLTLVLAGAFLRSWAAGIIRKSDFLATDGPYCLSRHPLYLGSLSLAMGFCSILGDVKIFVAVLALAVFIYLPTILREERFLSEKFGPQWEFYKLQTGVLFPKKLPNGLFIPWSFRQWKRNREYRAFLTSLLSLVLLHSWHSF